MNLRRIVPLLLAALLLAAGCGGERGGGEGTASLWVTRDRGAQVLLVRTVPAGLTAMEALQRVAKVETRYGGRFVQAIEGIEGSLERRRDWFYFINGYEADRGAAEYRLRPGDVEWWDYRSWGKRRREPVVVGAFPEPFVHGYDGKTRPAAVRYSNPDTKEVALAVGRLIGADSVAPKDVPVSDDANLLLLVPTPGRFSAATRPPGAPAGAPVRFVLSAKGALRLVKDRKLARFRYQGLP